LAAGRVTPLAELSHFLLDMDGTVYLGPQAIAGAAEFIAYLRASGRRHLFFTNNPTRDAAAYAEKLSGMGIAAGPEDILTSGEATVRYLLEETPHRRVYAVAPPSFEAELARSGIAVVEDGAEAVVLSFDTSLTYGKLKRACLLLAGGVPYIATNPDRVCPTEYGYIPDCGAMAALLEAATGRTPMYVGKPSAAMARMGMAKIGARPGSAAMVGDRLYTDLAMAHSAGIAGVLVLSGESTAEDAAAAPHRPDYVFPSVKELTDALRAADSATPARPGPSP